MSEQTPARAEVSVDTQRNLYRVEVFVGEQCVASRVAHDLTELKQIGEDFAPLNATGLQELIENIISQAN